MSKRTRGLVALFFIPMQICMSQFLTISVTENVHSLVSDNLGRKTGFDSATEGTVRNIPNSGYSLEGLGYIGEEENVKSENVYEFWLADRDNIGPFLITVFGRYGGKYSLMIARGIENRFVLDQERYVGRGMSEEFTLSFSPSNEGVLTKHIRLNSLKEELQAIYAAGDLGDERFYNELLHDVERFEGDLGEKDTLKAVKDLEKFQEKITKEHAKGIHQSPKRYIRPAAWKVLYDDAQSLIGQLIQLPPRSSGTLLEQLDSLKTEIKHQRVETNLGGVLLVRGLELLVNQANRSLQRKDSVRASRDLALFLALVREVNELTRAGWKKNKRHPALFLNDEAYVELYYRAQYIIEALPAHGEEDHKQHREMMDRTPELAPLGKELDSLKLKIEQK